MHTKYLYLLLILGIAQSGFGQKEKPAFNFGDPIITDSLSTIFIPLKYGQVFETSNKLAMWGGYYANLVVYDFVKDEYFKLFTNNVFIKDLSPRSYYHYETKEANNLVTGNWVFLLVKDTDTNGNARIDDHDPTSLYVTDTKGKSLKRLTDTSVNVVSVYLYEKLGFALIKLQQDVDNDKSFKPEDRSYFFQKIDLSDHTLGQPISIQ